MPRPRSNRSAAGKSPGKSIEAQRHEQDTRTNIPTAEYQSMVAEDTEAPLRVAYQRRNRDLDPQLVWRGKGEQDLDDLVVNVPPLYIQEKVHPKVLIDDLMRQSKENREAEEHQIDMFADFNGLPEGADRTEFYQHDGYWQNRMVLGDSLQVMASLSEREGLQGKVQCIYIDPPYGIRFNSNFQWSTTSRDVRDGNREHITREPEQVKAFRDTWRDGIYSYLTYLRDRLTVARDLLTESGSIFVQIGDENVHRVRALMDEVFGDGNFISIITFQKSGGLTAEHISSVTDFVLWYAKRRETVKSRNLFRRRDTVSYQFISSPDDSNWGYAPAAASSAVETSGTFPSHAVPWAPLESAEEVAVYELYHVALADGLISRTKEVVVYGRYDLDLLDRAVVVGVVPNDQRVRGVNQGSGNRCWRRPSIPPQAGAAHQTGVCGRFP